MSEKRKTAAAPSSASDTAAAINDAMKKTGYNNSAASPDSKTVTQLDEAFAEAGPASAKLNQRSKLQ